MRFCYVCLLKGGDLLQLNRLSGDKLVCVTCYDYWKNVVSSSHRPLPLGDWVLSFGIARLIRQVMPE